MGCFLIQERFLWALVTFIGVFLASTLTLELMQRRERSPTITTIETTAMPISRVDFPTINLCATGAINIGKEALYVGTYK